MSPDTPGLGAIRAGLFALPLYGVILAVATRNAQPDPTTDPAGWAGFVSSAGYLAEHLASTVVGTILAVLGTVALGALLAAGRTPRLGLAGAMVSVVGHLLLTGPGMISTFATPAIGAAYLAGNAGVMSLTFPAALTLVFALGLLVSLTGGVLLGVAAWRSGVVPAWSGAVWLAGTLVFYALGAALGLLTTGASLPTQPVGAGLLAVAGAAMAWSAVRPAAEPAGVTPARSSGRAVR